MCYFGTFILGFPACDTLIKLTPFQGNYCCQMDTYQSEHQLAPCFGKPWVFMVRVFSGATGKLFSQLPHSNKVFGFLQKRSEMMKPH